MRSRKPEKGNSPSFLAEVLSLELVLLALLERFSPFLEHQHGRTRAEHARAPLAFRCPPADEPRRDLLRREIRAVSLVERDLVADELH
jgi:hypothetical protein